MRTHIYTFLNYTTFLPILYLVLASLDSNLYSCKYYQRNNLKLCMYTYVPYSACVLPCEILNTFFALGHPTKLFYYHESMCATPSISTVELGGQRRFCTEPAKAEVQTPIQRWANAGDNGAIVVKC